MRGDEYTAGAALQAQQHVSIVVQRAARAHGAEVGAEGFNLQPGHGTQQVFGMRANVAHGARRAAQRRVHTPGGLLAAGGLGGRGQPALVVLHHHLAHRADGTALHHVAHLAHQRVAGVVVGHAKHRALFFDGGHQVARLRTCVHQRLVAHHMEAGFHKGLGHGVVQVVGRDDGNKVDALFGWAAQLVGQQLLPAAVVAVIGQKQVAARGACLVGAAGEGAGHQFDLAVQRGSLAVHAADEGIAAAAHHGIAQAAWWIRSVEGKAHEACWSLANTASNAPAAGLKSRRLQKAALSVAPCSRSMRLSSHSTLRGPA